MSADRLYQCQELFLCVCVCGGVGDKCTHLHVCRRMSCDIRLSPCFQAPHPLLIFMRNCKHTVVIMNILSCVFHSWWMFCYKTSDCDSTVLHAHHSVIKCFSLAGCPEASICNIYRAVQAVTEQGSLGVIVAHWSGSYHLTPHPFSWPGFVVGSGLSWNPATHWVSATV
jgi:hypothetical protein